jgi:hypothetical protein
VLGKGRRLFGDGTEKTVFKPSGVKTFRSGVTVLTYARGRKA